MKSIFIIFCICFGLQLSAETLYTDHDHVGDDYSGMSFKELQSEASQGNDKALYLIALRKIHNVREKNEGVQILEQLASKDIIDAKHSLYMISKWVKVDSLTPEKALNYLKEAAEEGYSESQLELAIAYIKGAFGKKDPEQSHYWLEKSAEQNNAEAMAYTAINYFRGISVPKDDSKGFEWITKSYNVLGGRFSDWRLLGQAYEGGRGTPINLSKAYMCYDMLGSAGIEEKARIAPHMTVAQREEGLRLSYEWQKKYHSYTMQSLGLKRQKDGSYQ